MKKLLLTLCVCLLGIVGARADRGDMGLGLNLGVAPCIESGSGVCNFGLGVKYQYNISNPVRIEGNFDYWFADKGLSFVDVIANIHYQFRINNRFDLYPIAGLGWGNIHSDYGKNYSRFIFNFGVGAEYKVLSNLSVDFEFKYQYVKDFQRLPIQLGVTYNF